jgi:CRISPR/Cas system-associated protein endoribonuclease Cas2
MNSKDQISIPDQILFVSESIQTKNEKQVRQKLIELVNELINENFSTLLRLLYSIDVNEKKIRLLLEKNPTEDSASIIADLIIERQLQKIASRKLFKENQDPDCGEERW